MSARLGPRLGPGSVGQRVVLRRRLSGGRFADVLGDLVAWDRDGDGLARVVTRHGEVAVPLRDVVAGKPVPAARRSGEAHRTGRSAGRTLEDVAADGWRPLELEWLGGRGQGWRLRAAEGFTGRANSVLPLGDPGLGARRRGRRGRAVVRRARSAGSRSACRGRWTPPALDTATTRASGPATRRSTPCSARAATPSTPRRWCSPRPCGRWLAPSTHRARRPAQRGLRLTVDDEPDDAWLAVYRYRGQHLPPVARRLLLSAPAQAFVSVRAGDTTVAVGRAASSRGWTGVTAMEVARLPSPPRARARRARRRRRVGAGAR